MDRRRTTAALMAAGLLLSACGADDNGEAEQRAEELEAELAFAVDRIAELEEQLELAAEADDQDDDDEFNGMSDDADATDDTVDEVEGVDPSELEDAHRVPALMIDHGFPLPAGAAVVGGSDNEYSWSVTFEHEAPAMDGVLALYRGIIEDDEGYDVSLDDDVRVDDERRLGWAWTRDTFEYETDDGMELESERYRMYLRGDEQPDGSAMWRLSWNDAQAQREALAD
jgi:hypothetical protein